MKAINIISFDVPFPANYGGVIDVYYKIKAFHTAGIKVHLHCFEYGRGEQLELNKYCETVSYYKRKTVATAFLSGLPYIVKSRVSKKLKTNLLSNNYPILFEGLHCCFLLNDNDLKSRFKIVRNHNIEHDYYQSLAKNETNKLRKKYFTTEAKKLKKFESILNETNLCLAISESDFDYLQKQYPKINILHISAFHQSETVKIKDGLGDYVLYHGNLSVNENKNAVKFIVNQIFSKNEIPLIIAGLNPNKEILNLIKKYKHIRLLENLSDADLNKLIANAQINLLYTNQATGLKLKLLNVLHNGRHCLVNSKMIEGSKLSDCCHIEDDAKKMHERIKELMMVEISQEEIVKRKSILDLHYTNKHSIDAILEHLP